jgi:hypothetical protein
MNNPIDSIVAAFVALRDTILGVRKTSKEDLRAWFITHVEPLHELMRGIYDDYSAGFGELADMLRAETDPVKAIELLKDLRLEKVRDRVEVGAISSELANARRRRILKRGLGLDFYSLFAAVDEFSTAAAPEQHLSFYSAFIGSFEDIMRRGDNPWNPDLYPISSPRKDPRLDVINRLDYCRQSLMPSAWAKYTAAYQRVRLHCV